MKFWAVNKLDNKTAEILMYGYIGDDVIASEFAAELKTLSKENNTINIRINSGGGSVFEGLAIFNAIKNCDAEVIGFIDGIAASMGTVIALACKKIYMSKLAMFMTHRASGISVGNAADMRSYANVLESLENVICSIYSEKTGLSKEEAKAKYLSNEDRWLTAEQALQEKIIDGVYDAKVKAQFPDNFKDPKELVAIYNKYVQPQQHFFNMKNINLSADQLVKLNLSNADETAIQLAMDNIIADALEVPQLRADLKAANTAKETAETEVANLKAAAVAAEVKSILDKGLDAKKMTVEMQAQLAKDYATNPAGLKALVDALPAHNGIVTSIEQSKDSRVKELVAKSWDDLDKEGLLEELKAKDEAAFKVKYKETFDKEYKG